MAKTAGGAGGGRRGALLAGLAGGVLAGLAIAALTLRLNPHIHALPGEALILAAYFAGAYGLAGLAAGGVAAIALTLAALVRVPPGWIERAAWAAGAVLALGPVVYAALLPDSGLAGEWMSDLIFAAPRGEQFAVAAAAAAGLAGVGLAVRALLHRGGPAAGSEFSRARLLPAGAFVAAFAALLAWIALAGAPSEGTAAALLPGAGAARGADATTAPPSASAARTPTPPPTTLAPPTGPPPPRVVLLCIDGADLDDVVLPMVAKGELPTFARLMKEGTWGELATLEPTLSAVVWTTIATGKPPAAHGIRHFVNFRLPGLGPSIEQFPLHAGLNFHLIRWLERVPGVPPIEAPYTSNMRRAEALWGIVGRVYPVGAYQWLVTWPAEEVNGFMVAGGLDWVQFAGVSHGGGRGYIRQAATYPPFLERKVFSARVALRRRIGPGWLRLYSGAEGPLPTIDPETGEITGDPRWRTVVSSLEDPTWQLLPRFIHRFDARFTAASFYPVDPYHHLFSAARERGGRFSRAIDEAYRLTDARLGQLLVALGRNGEEINLIVVSDHGFDFVHRHHTWAPAGVFFARGPAFSPGRRVGGLSVYDVAPLVLHLVGLPLPDDMPGAKSGAYLGALDPTFLAAHPQGALGRIATYETGRRGDHAPVAGPQDDALRDVLRSLGYIR